MTEVLGHDCNGRPLRAGDRVEFIGGPLAKPNRIGSRGVVMEIAPNQITHFHYRSMGLRGVPLRYRDEAGDPRITVDDQLRKLDDLRPGDWSEVEKATGWHPEREREEA